jgi:hypothetical protein
MLQLRPNCECCNTDLPPNKLANNPPSRERVFKPQGCAPRAG